MVFFSIYVYELIDTIGIHLQVYVSDHVPPPPTHLQVLMEDFVQWLNSPEAQRLHPIKYAALAHYKLVFIHPFADGNGRTARLLMNFLLMQVCYVHVLLLNHTFMFTQVSWQNTGLRCIKVSYKQFKNRNRCRYTVRFVLRGSARPGQQTNTRGKIR